MAITRCLGMDKFIKQSTLSEIFLTEYQLVADFPHKEEEYFKHAISAFNLMQSFFITTKYDGWLFTAFLAHVKKHYLLAFLSIMRLHHVQTMMNFRQVLESGVNAGYAIVNPVVQEFSTTSPEGLLETPKRLQLKRYEWLEQNYPNASQSIVAIKKQMQFSAHSNIVDAHRNFEFQTMDKSTILNMPYFDKYNEFQVITDFWLMGNITIGLLNMFYEINHNNNVLEFSSNFLSRLQSLQEMNDRIKDSLKQTEKFKRADKKAKEKEERLRAEAEQRK